MPVEGGSTTVRNGGVIRGDVAGLIRHHFRDVDREHGDEVNHSNEDIVASRTPWNESWVNDGNGGLKRCEDSKEVLDYINGCLDALPPRMKRQRDGSYKPIKTRKDFPVVRDWVLELDPDAMADYREAVEMLEKARELEDEHAIEFYERRFAEERAEIDRLLKVMVERLREEVGAENFAGVAYHWDEGNPHAQALTLPIHEDKLNWKAFRPGNKFQNPKFHDDMRQALRDAGYMAFDERISGGAKHMPLKQYKDFKRSLTELHTLEQTVGAPQQQIEELQAKVKAYEIAHHRLDGLPEREARVEQRERKIADREAQVDQRSKSLDGREAALEQGQSDLDAARAALRRQQLKHTEDVRKFEDEMKQRREAVLNSANRDAAAIRDEANAEAKATRDRANDELTTQRAIKETMLNDGLALRAALNRAKTLVTGLEASEARRQASEELQALLGESQRFGHHEGDGHGVSGHSL